MGFTERITVDHVVLYSRLGLCIEESNISTRRKSSVQVENRA